MMNKKLSIIPIVIASIAIGSFAMYNESQFIEGEVSILMYKHTLAELTEKAEYAIVGTVEKITPIRVDMPKESDEDRVYTDILINVKEDLFGKYQNKQISVRILGGETETMRLDSHSSPEFKVGGDVFVFVSGISDGYTYNGHHFVVGQVQGTYDLTNGIAKNQHTSDSIQASDLISQVKQVRGLQ